MSLITFNIGVNDEKLDEILLKLNALKEQMMTTQAELDQIVADMNAAVSLINTLEGSVTAQIDKIFNEIVKLKDSSGNLNVDAVLALRDTLVRNVGSLTESVTTGLQGLDDLNPDQPSVQLEVGCSVRKSYFILKSNLA